MRRIGKRPSYRRWKTETTVPATSALTTSRPVCGRLSNPQKLSVSRRSWEIETGHPACQERPVMVARIAGPIEETVPWKELVPADGAPAKHKPSAATTAQRVTVLIDRDGQIRTGDLPLPKRMRYQAALRPVAG